MSTETINDLRARLFAAIDGVKDRTMTLDEARTIAELGQVMVNTAKAENDFLRITEKRDSPFLGTDARLLPNGITGMRRHLIKDD